MWLLHSQGVNAQVWPVKRHEMMQYHQLQHWNLTPKIGRPCGTNCPHTTRKKREVLCHSARLRCWIHLPLLVNIFSMELKNYMFQVFIWVWKELLEIKSQEEEPENRPSTAHFLLRLTSQRLKMLKEQVSYSSLSASWTEISWLWTISEASGLSEPAVKRRIL